MSERAKEWRLEGEERSERMREKRGGEAERWSLTLGTDRPRKEGRGSGEGVDEVRGQPGRGAGSWEAVRGK